jgi:hypothetical protein
MAVTLVQLKACRLLLAVACSDLWPVLAIILSYNTPHLTYGPDNIFLPLWTSTATARCSVSEPWSSQPSPLTAPENWAMSYMWKHIWPFFKSVTLLERSDVLRDGVCMPTSASTLALMTCISRLSKRTMKILSCRYLRVGRSLLLLFYDLFGPRDHEPPPDQKTARHDIRSSSTCHNRNHVPRCCLDHLICQVYWAETRLFFSTKSLFCWTKRTMYR